MRARQPQGEREPKVEPPEDGVRLSYSFQLDRMARVGKVTALPRRLTAILEYPEDHTVEMEIVVEDRTPRCSALRIVRNPRRGWLNGTELRRLPLQNWVEFVCATAGLVVDAPSGSDTARIRPAQDDKEMETISQEVQRATRRRVVDDDFLRKVAVAYDVGGHQQVNSELGPASESQVFRWIRKARELGFLDERPQ
jgi:hypothetical protein